MKPEVINGKIYPMWSQFVEKQDQFIGGILQDMGDKWDRSIGMKEMQTEITGIILRANGKDSAFFEVIGKEFICGFDVRHGGIKAGEDGWLTFSGYGDHTWRIKPKEDLGEG